MAHRALVIDDSRAMRTILSGILSEIGFEVLHGRSKAFFKGILIGGIIRPIGQFNIQITGFFVIGEVVFAMNGKCEDGRVVFDNGGRTVSLVNIAVDDQNISDKSFGLDSPGCNHAVIQPTVPLTMITEGMVGSAPEIDGNPFF